jgi:hypothetical protein
MFDDGRWWVLGAAVVTGVAVGAVRMARGSRETDATWGAVEHRAETQDLVRRVTQRIAEMSPEERAEARRRFDARRQEDRRRYEGNIQAGRIPMGSRCACGAHGSANGRGSRCGCGSAHGSASGRGSRMTEKLEDRIAEALGWTVPEVRSLSLPSLREIVRPVNAKLAHELTMIIREGGIRTER